MSRFVSELPSSLEEEFVNTDLLVDTIDTHTAGEPTRIVTGGLNLDLHRQGSVRETRDRFAEQYDHIRRYLMKEPRGHDSMFGAIPVSPTHDDADIGLFFMDNGGYLDMCGHGTIGTVKALIEVGMLPQHNELRVETPAGTITAIPQYDNDSVVAVTIQNVPSFVIQEVVVDVEHRGERLSIPATIAFAGNVFALVEADAVRLPLKRQHTAEFIELGLTLRDCINDQHDLVNPISGNQIDVELTEFFKDTQSTDQNITVFGNGLVDRSPCGTGTCAKMALLTHRGELSVDEEYSYQSLIGTEFTGRLVDIEKNADMTTVTPEITGSAYITGKHTFMMDPLDPLDGFRFGESA